MTGKATVTLNRRAIEHIIEQRIELLDAADATAEIEAEKADQDAKERA